jgi:hypothetical protein
MADLRIEAFPDDLLHQLKVRAAQERTTVKALMIVAAEKLVSIPSGQDHTKTRKARTSK